MVSTFFPPFLFPFRRIRTDTPMRDAEKTELQTSQVKQYGIYTFRFSWIVFIFFEHRHENNIVTIFFLSVKRPYKLQQFVCRFCRCSSMRIYSVITIISFAGLCSYIYYKSRCLLFLLPDRNFGRHLPML